MIEETRQSIIRDSNTAQQTLEFLLDRVGPNVRDIIINDVLHGDLDFSILTTLGFRQVKQIHFTKPGQVTSVVNLPSSLVSFRCADQLLVEFNNTLPFLEELVLENNHISKIDMTTLSRLKVLNVNRNQLTGSMEFQYKMASANVPSTRTLEFSKNVPKNIEELYINENQIRLIDLRQNAKLRVLHAVGNRMLRIQNVPPSVVDLRIEENPMVEVDYSAMPTDDNAETPENMVANMDYLESLHQYFSLKHKYEKDKKAQQLKRIVKARSRKQRANILREYRPNCVKCGRPFGTIFEQRDRRYIARCGNAGNPCGLNIQLYRGNHVFSEKLVYLFQDQMETTKETIISQKLDTLFSYISEEKSVEKFKKQLKEYSIDNNIYKDVLAGFNELHYSPHKRELVRNKITQIYELKNAMKRMLDDFQKEDNLEILHTITDIYVHEYLPEIHNLRLLNYEVMEMIGVEDSCAKTSSRRKGGDSSNEIVEEECPVRQLFQRDAALPKLENISGEPPRVIAFSV